VGSATHRRRPDDDPVRPRRRTPRALLLLLLLALAGCWDDPVREAVTVDLRQPRRVGLAVTIELDSPRELQQNPAARRTVELAAVELIDARHRWNERLQALDCPVEAGAWQKREGELRRYELSAECADPGAFAALLGDRQLVAELVFAPGGGELYLVPNGGGDAGRADRQRLTRRLDAYARWVARYVDAVRAVARRAEAHPDRALLLWHTLLVETDTEAAAGLTRAEKLELERALEAMGELLGAFQTEEREAESLDSLARRVFDPLPKRLELVVPARAEVEVTGLVRGEAGRWVVPPRGIEGALAALEGRWFEPDPALALLRHLRTESQERPDIAPFVRGSIVRSEETIDPVALAAEIEGLAGPPAELRLRWRRRPAAPGDAPEPAER
jgi:hypothetical protein